MQVSEPFSNPETFIFSYVLHIVCLLPEQLGDKLFTFYTMHNNFGSQRSNFGRNFGFRDSNFGA
jgi:hypothetical protein